MLNAIILGIVQGLTEFLPISSNAHLRLVGLLLGTGTDPGAAFTAIIQLGTELAVVVYFGADLWRIISRWFLALFGRIPRNDPDAKMGWFIILGSVPIVVLGVIFQKTIETTLRSLWVIAVTLIVFGILLGIADYVGAKKRRLRDLTAPHAAIYGGAQALALLPGVSRSGGTITAGLFLGYERAAAARYSFLLAIPAVFGIRGFHGGGDRRSNGRLFHGRTRRDRVLHELHLQAFVSSLRHLPPRPRRHTRRTPVRRGGSAGLTELLAFTGSTNKDGRTGLP